MIVYVSGPYTSGDVADNVRTAVDAADELARAGFTPVVPHLYLFWHYAHPHDYEFWMKLDMEILNVCDGVLRLPGHSPGADREVAYALEHSIPVGYTVQEVKEVLDV